jgi:cation diffusion facilitator CzcD-associated flavoprotein CzcO
VVGQDRNRRELSVGIVGGGFGGVGIGARLRRAGFDRFEIFERGETVGGVWRANTYPGAACDVPSHLYSFSFAPAHHWSRRYAPQPEILTYLEDCVDRFGLRSRLRLGTEVTDADFDPASGRWTLTTSGGERRSFDALITACGQLSVPEIPRLEGLDGFRGPAFHSAEWDHDVELAGRRVAVIGTGASAIQVVPAIAPLAWHTTVYQRSAPWILPKSDRAYRDWERRLFRAFPPRVLASRLAFFSFLELGAHALTGGERLRRLIRTIADRERRRVLGDDRELLAKATPNYEMGCKRVLITSDWYPTLRRDDVELITDPVERVAEGGVVAADGAERPADLIVFGTGFASHGFVAPMKIRGLDGRELHEVWGGRPEAYLGTTVSGFPNMFVLYGPNTNHGSGSVPYTLQCQFDYIVDALRRVRDRGLRWIDVRPAAQDEWRREIAERSRRTVWMTGGCHNWYLTDAGDNTNNWPGPWLEYRRRTRRINPADYRAAV